MVIKQGFYLSFSSSVFAENFSMFLLLFQRILKLHYQTFKNPVFSPKKSSFYSFTPIVSQSNLIMTQQKGSSSQLPSNDKPINFSKTIPTGSPQFIEEPEVKEAEEQIWKSQVIIACPILPHAYIGTIPDDKENTEELSSIFPCFKKHSPLIFTKGPYDLSFLKSKFRAEPRLD
jgi:hypothetical protein